MKRRNRIGDAYGVAVVIGDPGDGTWLIRWGCCNRIQAVKNDRAIGMEKTTPKRCIQCARGGDPLPAKSHKRPVVVTRKDAGIMLGKSWWPYLGKMGPRFGRGATYDN